MRVGLVVLLLLLAGCASDPEEDAADAQMPEDSSQTAAPVEAEPPEIELEVELTGLYPLTIDYSPGRMEIPAGVRVTLTFTNTDQNVLVSHDWVLEGIEGAATDVIGNGESSTVTFDAPPPGEYTYYCSVPGHRDNGMEGVFVVA